MKRRYRVAGALAGLLVLALAVGALVISYSSPCGPSPDAQHGGPTMTAVLARCYGGPEVLELARVAKPEPEANEVLVRIEAAALNPLDLHYLRGSPYLMRLVSGLFSPSDIRVGVDFAGVVETVGEDVDQFEPGQAVFGGGSGAFADYIVIRQDGAIAEKPEEVSFAQAAGIPIAAVSALQALRDKGQLAAGERVLINGASGGVGTYAVQIAKAMGAHVTGVSSARNHELVMDLGADAVIDYAQENFFDRGPQYDLIIDNVGNHSVLKSRRALRSGGRLVMVGGLKGNWLAPLVRPIEIMLVAPFVDERLGTLLAELSQEDLRWLSALMTDGQLRSAIDSRHALTDIRAAFDRSESRRARGKIVFDLGEGT